MGPSLSSLLLFEKFETHMPNLGRTHIEKGEEPESVHIFEEIKLLHKTIVTMEVNCVHSKPNLPR